MVVILWFWHDRWVGEGKNLKTAFTRLFDMSLQQSDHVSQMGEWVEGKWQWGLKWRRNMFEWETQIFREMMHEIERIQILRGKGDKWVWKATNDEQFSIKSANESQFMQGESGEGKIFKKVWTLAAPSNILSFTWRAMLNRVKTKDNLRKRNCIQQGTNSLCVFCIEEEESLNHLMSSCRFIWEIWMRCYRWFVVHTVLHEDARTMFLQHDQNLVTNSNCGWSSVWIEGLWTIWLHRNYICFNIGTANLDKVED